MRTSAPRTPRNRVGLESLRALATLFDQAWLSAINFGVGLLLIRLADKTDYAIYVQLFSALLLTVSIRHSIVDSPLLTLGPREQAESRQSFVRGILALQNRLLGVVLLMATLLMCSLPLFAPGVVLAPSLIVAVLAWTTGHWMREFVRIHGFLSLQPEQALYVDVAFGLLAGAGALVVVSGGITIVEAVGTLAIANVLAAGVMLWRLGIYRSPPRPWQQAWASVWPLARYALPGTVITWIFTYTFPYIASTAVSTAAAANLAATKLLVMPIGILSIAMTNLLQPKMAGWIAAGRLSDVTRTAILVALGATGLALLYLLLLFLTYGLIEQWVLGEDYSGLGAITLIWGLYAWLGLVRAVGLAVVLAGKQYQRMLRYNVIALLIYLPAVALGGYGLGQLGIVIGVVMAEAVIALLIWTDGLRSVRRSKPEQ